MCNQTCLGAWKKTIDFEKQKLKKKILQKCKIMGLHHSRNKNFVSTCTWYMTIKSSYSVTRIMIELQEIDIH